MKAFIGVLCALLIATAHCQQMASLENCLYNLGLLTADLSVVFRDRSNLQNKQNALAHLNSLNQQCSLALNSLGAGNGQTGGSKAQENSLVREEKCKHYLNVIKEVTPLVERFKSATRCYANTGDSCRKYSDAYEMAKHYCKKEQLPEPL